MTLREEATATHLAPGMDVRDMDGRKIGTIEHIYHEVEGSAFEAARSPSGKGEDGVMEVKTGILGLGEHLFIPIAAVSDSVDESVFLTARKSEMPEEWHQRPD
jgi:hypothetical protein